MASLAAGLVIGFHFDVRHRWTIAILLVSAMPLAGLRHSLEEAAYESASILAITSSSSQPTITEGIVDAPVVLRRHPLADQPSRRDQSPWQTKIELRVTRVKRGHAMQDHNGRLLVVINGRRDEIRPGDVIRVFGQMRQFLLPTNPGVRDLRRVYRQRGLHARVDVDSEAQIVVVGNQGFTFARTIASIAAAGRDRLLRHTSESLGPLAVALVIGQRDFVDADTRDLLVVTGTAHLLSVSGLHLAIIVMLASWTGSLLQLSSTPRMIWILSACFLYTAITGGRPPVMRASILVATLLFAIWMRRTSQPMNTLSLAAMILIFWNPKFVFSIGVQLSFLAVATLFLCGQRLSTNGPAAQQDSDQQERLRALVEGARWWPFFYIASGIRAVRQVAWFSGCVTAVSTPLVWSAFHVVSPVSVLANVLLGPLMFVSLAAGVVTVMISGVCNPLGFIPGKFCDGTLWVIRWLVEWFAAIPYGHCWLPAPPTWSVALFYTVLAATLLLPSGRLASMIRYGWVLVWTGLTWIAVTTPSPLDDGSMEATFVDVGHGTCVILRFSKDDVWLYDCGRLGNDTGSSRDIDATLWSLGVTRLQGIFLSHADADHFNAVPGVMRRFTVDQVITPPGMLEEKETALDPVRRAIDKSDTPVIEMSMGDAFAAGPHTIDVLHPPSKRLLANDNANSLVLRIECHGKTLLLPGDLEPPGTQWLVAKDRPPPGGALMAPHHGSLRMDAAAVLQWSRPSQTIVSGGRRARRPEVQKMLSYTGSGVYVTSNDGAIRIRVDPQGKIHVRCWTRSPW